MKLSDVRGERVLLRADLNVPMEDGVITGTQRLRAIVPTIKMLLKQSNAVIIVSHLGRPEGRQKKYSLKPIAQALSSMIGRDIIFSSDVLSKRTSHLASTLEAGQVLMLENIRYYPEEEVNDESFSSSLASLATVYVNDAFSVSHRAHASVVGVAKRLPSAFGLTMEAELEALDALLSPKRPSLAIVGGAKISTKLGVLDNLARSFDTVFVGGAMAFTLLKAKGLEVGRSKVEDAMLTKARRLLKHDSIVLPVDALVARSVSAHAKRQVKRIEDFDDEDIGLDIGPETIALIEKRIAKAKTIMWNGPMGLFELPVFAKGTYGVARAIAASKAHSVVGGGDTVAAIERIRVQKRFSHVSTGGGAMLEYLEGTSLPGIKAVRP